MDFRQDMDNLKKLVKFKALKNMKRAILGIDQIKNDSKIYIY